MSDVMGVIETIFFYININIYLYLKIVKKLF